MQGIAQALWEEATYDEDGNLLQSSMLNYLVPSAAELPSFELDRTETDESDQPARRQGRGGDGHDRLARCRDERRRRRALATSASPTRDAGDAGARLACDRGGEADDPRRVRLRGRGLRRRTRSSCSVREDAKLLAGGHSLLPADEATHRAARAARRHRPPGRAVATCARTATRSRSARSRGTTISPTSDAAQGALRRRRAHRRADR